jgi:hypothetical protein
MFSYAVVKTNPQLLLAMTSLTQEEFEMFLPYFQSAWDDYVRRTYIEREGRQRQYGGGQQQSTLVAIEDKLLFILYYLKVYPLQEILAFEFGMTQSTANTWIHILSSVVQQALATAGYLPEREPRDVAAVVSAEPEFAYGIDGTERRIQRPTQEDDQRYYYSGKKKMHTVKNIIIGGLTTRTVTYLSQTHEGKKHDKRIADEENPTFPEGILLFKDTGFQGYEPENITTVQPKKKPRGKELTREEKEGNTFISKIRVIIEHIINGIKRCRIVKDIFRNTKHKFADLVMEIACGLHNLRTECRTS